MNYENFLRARVHFIKFRYFFPNNLEIKNVHTQVRSENAMECESHRTDIDRR